MNYQERVEASEAQYVRDAKVGASILGQDEVEAVEHAKSVLRKTSSEQSLEEIKNLLDDITERVAVYEDVIRDPRTNLSTREIGNIVELRNALRLATN